MTADEVFHYVRDNVARDAKGRQHPAVLSSKYDPQLPLAVHRVQAGASSK